MLEVTQCSELRLKDFDNESVMSNVAEENVMLRIVNEKITDPVSQGDLLDAN